MAVDDISKTLGSGIYFTLAFQELSRFLASDSAPVYLVPLVPTTLSHNKGWGLINTGKQTWLLPTENSQRGKGILKSFLVNSGKTWRRRMNVSVERNLVNDLFQYVSTFYTRNL